MYNKRHFLPILEALFVTFLWSTSWVLIKRGLHEIPPLTFAGIRYGLAFLILLPGLWWHRGEVRRLTRRDWVWLGLLGVVLYAFTQGGQFLALQHLNATPFSLLLSFSPVLVAAAGLYVLKERPRRLQWMGIGLLVVGALVFFVPQAEIGGSALGYLFAAITVLAGSVASLLGRAVNRRKMAHPLVVTCISMGIGSACLLTAGIGIQGLPPLSASSWGIIAWLAVVNTAFAFTLWNHSLRVLSATESSVINNTMLIQIAILAWIFLGERLGWVQIGGLLLVAGGSLLVQLRAARKSP